VITRKLDVALEDWVSNSEVVSTINGGSAVMFRSDEILKAGNASPVGCGLPENPRAENQRICLTDTNPPPSWAPLPNMPRARNHLYLIALPDGKVAAVGGPANTPVDIYDPYGDPNSPWSARAPMPLSRTYDSSAVLLPDGSIFVAGGPNDDDCSTPETRGTYQRYKPPYFYQFPRPTITSCPTTAKYGLGFNVYTPDAADVENVRLIRPGAATTRWTWTSAAWSWNSSGTLPRIGNKIRC
jgi:hypothetical protein